MSGSGACREGARIMVFSVLGAIMSQSVSECPDLPGVLLLAGAAALLMISCRQGGESGSGPEAGLPDAIAGWTSTEPVASYDAESIYEYINGHAEVYLAYGMKRSLARRYTGPDGEADIVLDLFELASPADAFGVFTHDLDGVSVGIGNDSRLRYGWLSFWRGPWFVSVSAEMESDKANQAVLGLGRAVAAILPSGGGIPKVVDELPTAGLDPNSVRFLRHPQILNTHIWLDDENVFGLGAETAAALGTYDFEGTRCYLLIVDYPAERQAAAAEKSFNDRVLGGAPGGDIQTVEDRGWFAVMRSGARVVAVLGADTQELAQWLLGEATGVADD
jgi:hypothetical protein